MVSGDHPRVCGEKCQLYAKPSVSVGSPPRMQGKEAEQAPASEHSRITPAYAGKRRLTVLNCLLLQDHPRVCGEKYLVASEVFLCKGSPPRMRGKVPLCSADCLRPGITPAYAGKRLKRSRSTVSHVAIVPLFPSVCNKPVVSDGSPAGRDAPLFLPAENAVPASPAYNLRSL